jgi:uncharacterized membrane protein
MMTLRELGWRRPRRRASRAANAAVLLASLGAGAAAAALLQPRGGARRRGLVVQRAIHAGKVLEEFGEKSARDLANRSRGAVAEARSRLRGAGAPPEVLCERVRARLGRLTAHAGAIAVTARGGTVELRGPVLRAEAGQVLEGVRRVRGVREVVDLLERHAEPGRVAGLQGGTRRARPLPQPLQADWAPATRLAAIVLGSGLVALGLRSRGPAALVLGGPGALLALRGASNLPMRRLVGFGASRRAVDLRKTIHVEAPRSEVFDFFAAFENFPRFMSHVRGVAPLGEGRWRWVVDGPAGSAVQWDAEVTAFAPGQAVGWKTLPGAAVESAGIVQFEDEGSGTRLDVRLSYNPPAGAIGHALAVVLGADPKHRMDDDLLRLKSLLERGKAEGVRREQLRRDGPPA